MAASKPLAHTFDYGNISDQLWALDDALLNARCVLLWHHHHSRSWSYTNRGEWRWGWIKEALRG